MMIRKMLEEGLAGAGAVAWGVAACGSVGEREMEGWRRWIAEGRNAGMEYMERYEALRREPEGLLPGCRSIISVAFNYTPAVKGMAYGVGRNLSRRDTGLPRVASFAYGMDYHDVIRKRLSEAVEGFKRALRDGSGNRGAENGENPEGEWRICVDSAPVFERYWAEVCGVGTRADNGLIYVRPYGTRILLAEILTTVVLTGGQGDRSDGGFLTGGQGDTWTGGILTGGQEDRGLEACIHCGECRRVCPAGALQEDSTVDARRCLSYLTIEHRGDWTSVRDEAGVAVGEAAMRTAAGRQTLFGCDLCQDVCPLNRRPIPTEIGEFTPIPTIASEDLTRSRVLEMTQEEFSAAFKGSPIKRAKLAGLRRNAENLQD